jgi:hypothetical protein
MTLTNLKTVTPKTATVASAMLTTPADRIGLGFGAGLAYPADSLSLGQFPTPHNPAPEQVRSRQGQSATQMRKQMRAGGPDAVPPAGSAGCLPPGPRAARVAWPLTSGESWLVRSTDHSRNRLPEVRVVRSRIGRDCQSPDRQDDKRTLLREVAPATAAGK